MAESDYSITVYSHADNLSSEYIFVPATYWYFTDVSCNEAVLWNRAVISCIPIRKLSIMVSLGDQWKTIKKYLKCIECLYLCLIPYYTGQWMNLLMDKTKPHNGMKVTNMANIFNVNNIKDTLLVIITSETHYWNKVQSCTLRCILSWIAISVRFFNAVSKFGMQKLQNSTAV